MTREGHDGRDGLDGIHGGLRMGMASVSHPPSRYTSDPRGEEKPTSCDPDVPWPSRPATAASVPLETPAAHPPRGMSHQPYLNTTSTIGHATPGGTTEKN